MGMPVWESDFAAVEAKGKDTQKTCKSARWWGAKKEKWSQKTGHRILYRGYIDEIAPRVLVVTVAGPDV